jgi:hypothetical protein
MTLKELHLLIHQAMLEVPPDTPVLDMEAMPLDISWGYDDDGKTAYFRICEDPDNDEA